MKNHLYHSRKIKTSCDLRFASSFHTAEIDLYFPRMVLFTLSLFVLSWGAAEGATGLEKAVDNAFSLTGDFAYFKREQAHKHKLIIDNSSRDCNCQFPSCRASELVHHFSFEPGFKVAVTYTSEHSIWDFSYLWLNEWEKSCGRSSPGNLIFSVKNPGITTDFDGADHGNAEYSSRFQNCELNYIRYVTPRYGNYFSSAYLLGLRYMNLREVLNVSFTKGESRSSYNVHTSNHIPAIQVGGQMSWNPTRTVTWDLMGKAGVGFDLGEQKTFLGDQNNTVTVRDYETTGFSTPLVAEAALRFTYLPTNYFNIHFAYQVIYLNGVILAPDQLVKSSSDRHAYRDVGAALIHGLTAGISFSF